MNSPENHHQRYQGYRATPPLWAKQELLPHPQITLPTGPTEIAPAANQNKQRLGKLAESFVYHQLRSLPTVEWIADGLQIQQNNRTVGELDALYYDRGTPVHLEVAYKFYLYDTLAEYTDPLARWIGPNRKDNLSLKLKKLHSKQFPLLHHPAAATYLAGYGLTADHIEQRVCLKGQLFLPYDQQHIDLNPLNPDCVAGFYLSFQKLAVLEAYHFFVPRKLDWLIVPHPASHGWILRRRSSGLERTLRLGGRRWFGGGRRGESWGGVL